METTTSGARVDYLNSCRSLLPVFPDTSAASDERKEHSSNELSESSSPQSDASKLFESDTLIHCRIIFTPTIKY